MIYLIQQAIAIIIAIPYLIIIRFFLDNTQYLHLINRSEDHLRSFLRNTKNAIY